MWRCNTDAFTHRHLLHTDTFYTQKLLHTDVFTQTLLHAHGFLYMEIFYTQTHLHTDAFTQRRFLHTHTHLSLHRDVLHTNAIHIDAFTHKRRYTQNATYLILKNTFAVQPFCVENLLWKRPPPHHHTTCGVQPFLHITLQICKEIVFPHGGFFTQTPLHTNTFTHRGFYTHTHKPLHTDAFTHRRF